MRELFLFLPPPSLKIRFPIQYILTTVSLLSISPSSSHLGEILFQSIKTERDKGQHSAPCFRIFPQLKVLVPQNLTCMHHAHMYHPDIYKYNTQSTQLPLAVHKPSTHTNILPTEVFYSDMSHLILHYALSTFNVFLLHFVPSSFSWFSLSWWYGWNFCFYLPDFYSVSASCMIPFNLLLFQKFPSLLITLKKWHVQEKSNSPSSYLIYFTWNICHLSELWREFLESLIKAMSCCFEPWLFKFGHLYRFHRHLLMSKQKQSQQINHTST